MTRKSSPLPNVLSLAALTLLITGGILYAGPLNPPAGPVTSTNKTLTEVEPRIAVDAVNTPGDADSLYRISQPGSYYLTGNITGVVGKHGIEIESSGVTLDLSGYELVGTAGMGFFSGVTVTGPNRVNIAVMNGSVRNWEGDAGVDLLGVFGASNCRVERVLASGNTNFGIRTGGSATVTNCSSYLNVGTGISALNGIVSNCSVFNNGATGINLGTGCTVADCVVRLNTLDGIRCVNECVVRGNTCSNNGNGAGSGAGVHATGTNNRIESNNCTTADRGIDVDAAGNIIVKNTCSDNATNWDVVAGNIILVVNGTAAAAVLGSSGGTAPGSTDPNANFSY